MKGEVYIVNVISDKQLLLSDKQLLSTSGGIDLNMRVGE